MAARSTAGNTTSNATAAAGASSSGRARKPACSTDGRVLQRQGLATRGKLLDAAVPALAEHGFHAVRVDDVVRRAGVSHGTFYLYFADKEDLFLALAERCADEADDLVAALHDVGTGPDSEVALRAWLVDFIDYYRRHGVVIRNWTENQVIDRKLARLGRDSFDGVSAVLRNLVAEAQGTTEGVELRAAALLAMIERLSYVVTSRDVGLDDAAVAETLARVVHRGFLTPASA